MNSYLNSNSNVRLICKGDHSAIYFAFHPIRGSQLPLHSLVISCGCTQRERLLAHCSICTVGRTTGCSCLIGCPLPACNNFTTDEQTKSWPSYYLSALVALSSTLVTHSLSHSFKQTSVASGHTSLFSPLWSIYQSKTVQFIKFARSLVYRI